MAEPFFQPHFSGVLLFTTEKTKSPISENLATNVHTENVSLWKRFSLSDIKNNKKWQRPSFASRFNDAIYKNASENSYRKETSSTKNTFGISITASD